MINTKESNQNEYSRGNRFDVRLNRKVAKLIQSDNETTYREAIKEIQQKERAGASQGKNTNQAFKGNSNKCQLCKECAIRIVNRVQKRRDLRKQNDQLIRNEY